jgi:nucleotide-binding universal stress UspA family protein
MTMTTTTLAPVTVSFERILVPTDFSDPSDRALDYAKSIARQYQSRIFLVHVNPGINPVTPPEAIWIDSESIQEQLAQQLEQAGAALRSEGFKAEGFAATGSIRDAIYSIVKENRIDLLVMGTHGRTGCDRLLFGSDTESVLRQVNCPVIVVGPGVKLATEPVWHPKRVVCATTLDPDSAWIAAYGFRLAQQHQAAFTLFNVEDLSRKGRAVDWAVFESAFKKNLPDGTNFNGSLHTLVTDGAPGFEIVDYAKESGADLIVMGARVSADIATHLFRGTASKVFSEAPCPILTLRQQ